MRIGFTGTREGMNVRQINQIYRFFSLMASDGPLEFHHGDCMGADAQAHDIARDFDAYIVGHPPIHTSKRAFRKCDYTHSPLDYIARNHAIVDAVDILIATPATDEEQQRSGTWATIRYAHKKEKLGPIWGPTTDVIYEGRNGNKERIRG